MTRILLALLAVLGFAAQTAHAESGMRAVGRAQVGAVQTVGAQGRTAVAAAKRCAAPVIRQAARTLACLPVATLQSGWRAPAVLPRIDRARE
jgi:hypothetical protein